MIEITTNKKPKQLIKIDEYEYSVRNLGAGETMSIQQAQTYIEKMQPKIENETATKDEIDKYQNLSKKVFSIITSLIDAQGNEEAQQHFDRIEPDELGDVVGKILSAMNKDKNGEAI